MNSNKHFFIIQSLKAQGYTVQGVDSTATDFNKRYKVYRKVGARKLRVLVNENGKVMGEQG